MNGLPNLHRIFIIARKELLVLLGNRISRMLIIIPPLAQIIIFGWAATMDVRNVRAIYLNSDNGIWSWEAVQALMGSPTFKSVTAVGSHAEIRKCLDEQKALVALVFDAQFSRNIAAGRPATVQLLLDGRRSNAAQIVSGYISEIMATVAARTPLGSQMRASAPVNIEIRNWFNPNLNFQWFFLPNLIGMITLMLGLVVTGLSVARERENGTFDQLLVSPATPTEIALAKLIPGSLIGIIHGTLFLLISVFAFAVPFNGSLFLLYVAMLIFASAAGAMGLMVSSLSATQQQAFLGAFTIGVPCILLSGAITPIINMPETLQYATQLNPLRHFTVICQGVFLKEITGQAALLNLAKILLISLAAVAVAIWMFKRRS